MTGSCTRVSISSLSLFRFATTVGPSYSVIKFPLIFSHGWLTSSSSIYTFQVSNIKSHRGGCYLTSALKWKCKRGKYISSNFFKKKHYEEEEEFLGEFSILGEIEREAKLNMFWRLVDHRLIMVSVEANCDLSNTRDSSFPSAAQHPNTFPHQVARARLLNWKCIPSARSSSTFFFLLLLPNEITRCAKDTTLFLSFYSCCSVGIV